MPTTHPQTTTDFVAHNTLTRRLQAARNRPNFIQAMNDCIEHALAEDIGSGDITTESIFDDRQTASAHLLARQDGILAGLPVFLQVFIAVNPALKTEPLAEDGQVVRAGDVLARISGPVVDLLKAERVALNLLQRASGIASLTRRFVQAARQAGRMQVLDTRKTAPGLRWLDKYAVLAGGGRNHRFGLYDMALIKENHIQAAGGIVAAVQRVRDYQSQAGQQHPIEVEVTSLDELREALALRPNRILLDNMDDKMIRQAVAIAAGAVPLEASGNVTLERMPSLAATGVDCVSVGALTHSAQALDFSLLLADS